MSKPSYYLGLSKYQRILAKHEYIYKNETSGNIRKNTDSHFWLFNELLSPSKVIIFTAFRNIFSFFKYKNFTFLQIYMPSNYPIQRNTKKTYSLKRSYSKARFGISQYQNQLLKPNTNTVINYAIQRYICNSSTKPVANPRLEHFRLNKEKYPSLCKYCKRIGKTKKPKTFFGWICSMVTGGPKESGFLKDSPKCCTSTCKVDDKTKTTLKDKQPPVKEKKKTNSKNVAKLAPCVTDNVDIKQTESNTEGVKPSETKVEIKKIEESDNGSNIHDKLNELCKKYDLEDVWLSDKADKNCEKNKISQCSDKQSGKGHDEKLSKILEICKPDHKEECKTPCETKVENKRDDHKINKKKSCVENKCKKDKAKDDKSCLEKLKALAASADKQVPCSEKQQKTSECPKVKPCIEKMSKSSVRKKECTPIISYNVDITSYISKATGKLCNDKTKKSKLDKEYQLSVVLTECLKEGKLRKDPCNKLDDTDKKCQTICSNQLKQSSAKKVSSLENKADKCTLDNPNLNLFTTKIQDVRKQKSAASLFNPQEIKDTIQSLHNNQKTADEIDIKSLNESLMVNSPSEKTDKLSVLNAQERYDKDESGNVLLHSKSKQGDAQIIEFFRIAEEQKRYDNTNENKSILRDDQSNELQKLCKATDQKEKYEGNDVKVNENLKAFVADDQLNDLIKSSKTINVQDKCGDENKSFDLVRQLDDLNKLSNLIDELTKRNNKIINKYDTSKTNVKQNEPIELSDLAEEKDKTEDKEEKCNENNNNNDDNKSSVNTNEQNEQEKFFMKANGENDDFSVNSKSKQSEEESLTQNNIKPLLNDCEQTSSSNEKTDGNIQLKLPDENSWPALLPKENNNSASSFTNINKCVSDKITESYPYQVSQGNGYLKKNRSMTDNTKKRVGVKYKTISKTKSMISSKKFKDNNLQKKQSMMIRSNTDIYSDMTSLLPRKFKKRSQKKQSKKLKECLMQKNDNSQLLNDITKIVKFGKVLNEARDPDYNPQAENFNKPVWEKNTKINFGEDKNSVNGISMKYSKKFKIEPQGNEKIKNTFSQHAMNRSKQYQASENLNKPTWHQDTKKTVEYDANSVQGMFVKSIGINKLRKLSQEASRINDNFTRTIEDGHKQYSKEETDVRVLSHKTQEFCKVMLELVQLFSEYKASSELKYCDRSIENLREKQMKIKELHNTVKSLEENLMEFLHITTDKGGVPGPSVSTYNNKYKYFSYEGAEKTSAFERRKNSASAISESHIGRYNQGIRQYRTLSKTEILAENLNHNAKGANGTTSSINKDEFRKTLIDLIFLFTSPDEIFNKSDVISKSKGLKRKQQSS